MAVIKGSNVQLQQGDGGDPTETFTVVAGSRSVNFSLGGDEIDTTTADDIASGVTWRTYISGIADFSASFDGLIKDKATFNGIVADRLADTVRNYKLDIEGYGEFDGPCRVTVVEGAGNFDDVATVSVTVRAAGAMTYTPEP